MRKVLVGGIERVINLQDPAAFGERAGDFYVSLKSRCETAAHWQAAIKREHTNARGPAFGFSAGGDYANPAGATLAVPTNAENASSSITALTASAETKNSVSSAAAASISAISHHAWAAVKALSASREDSTATSEGAAQACAPPASGFHSSAAVSFAGISSSGKYAVATRAAVPALTRHACAAGTRTVTTTHANDSRTC